MSESEHRLLEAEDPTMKPISDAWWDHMLTVFKGNPPGDRSMYRMPSEPGWGPQSPTRFEALTVEPSVVEEVSDAFYIDKPTAMHMLTLIAGMGTASKADLVNEGILAGKRV